MNWARIDTRIADHPKMSALPETTQYAYIKVILWCREWDTDGIVPASIPFRTFTKHRPEDARRALLASGLLEICADRALRVPHYSERQPPTDQERRTRWANNKRKQRAKTSQNTPNVPMDVPETVPEDVPETSPQMSTQSPRLTVRNGTERTPPPPSVTENAPREADLERLTASDFNLPPRRLT